MLFDFNDRDQRLTSLDNVLEVGDTIGIPQLADVVDVDRLGTSTAGNEDVGLVAKVSSVAEVGSVGDDLSSCWDREGRSARAHGSEGERPRTRKGKVAVVDEHAVSVLRELAGIELGDHLPGLGETDELLAVESERVVDGSTAVDDAMRGGRGSASVSPSGREISERRTQWSCPCSRGSRWIRDLHRVHQSAPW